MCDKLPVASKTEDGGWRFQGVLLGPGKWDPFQPHGDPRSYRERTGLYLDFASNSSSDFLNVP